jgi:hypothetical protein
MPAPNAHPLTAPGGRIHSFRSSVKRTAIFPRGVATRGSELTEELSYPDTVIINRSVLRPSLCRSCDSNTKASTQESPAEWSNHLVHLSKQEVLLAPFPRLGYFNHGLRDCRSLSIPTAHATRFYLSTYVMVSLPCPSSAPGLLSNLARINDFRSASTPKSEVTVEENGPLSGNPSNRSPPFGL